MAKRSAIAVSAFSPPDNCIIFCSFFPGGCEIITIPASRISSPSTSSIVPRPPPNNSLNTLSNSTLISSNFSLNWILIPLSSSSITWTRASSALIISSCCVFKKLYRSLTSLYSSIALTLTTPSFLILAFRMLICFLISDISVSSSLLNSAA